MKMIYKYYKKEIKRQHHICFMVKFDLAQTINIQ